MPYIEPRPQAEDTNRTLPRLVEAARGRFPTLRKPGPPPQSRLPPGGRDDLDALEKADRSALMKRAADLGPIFTGVSHGELCVVVMGLPRGRRILIEHADALRPWALDATSLVPKGVLRHMQGADHLDYRRPLVRAAKRSDPVEETAMLERVIRHHLEDFTARGDTSSRALLATASATATSMLVALFFGFEPGSEVAQRLSGSFHDLGPHGLAWNIGPPQHAAFAVLREILENALDARRGADRAMNDRCVLAQIADENENGGTVDETMLGNLIFAVEIGRMDVANQLRWLTRYAAADPSLLEEISAESVGRVLGERSLAEAFAFEQLRSDQSERLTRVAQRDIEFEGFLIPAGSHIRVCMWEAHHDPDTFPNPDRFDPRRFVGALPSNDCYAPFGVDHHQCPFGAAALRIATTYVRILATEFHPTLINDGPPVRGAYHWEPSRRLAVSMRRAESNQPSDPSPEHA